MTQPVLLLLLLAAMSSPVFGTEISVLEGTSVTLVCTYLGDKKLKTCWGRGCGFVKCTDPIMEDKSKYKINAEVGRVNLTILKLQPTDRGSYCCRVDVPGFFNDLKQFYSLRVVKGCVRDLLDEVHFLGNNIANQPFTTENASQCRQECTKNYTCQYFTFVDENAGKIVHRNKCFLKASTGHTPEITIQHLQHGTSGYSLRNCSGKVTHSAKKYSLVPEKKNWTEAQEYCRQHYTNLAIIRTEEDWKAIQSSLGDFSGDVWIGLHRSGPTEKWKWSDGEDFMFFNWKEGFGVHAEGHDCVLSISSHWQPVTCAALSQYMCQRVHHGNGTTEKVYELMQEPKTQQDAVTDCRKINGGELASICNQKEQEAFDEVTTGKTWIGLQQKNKLWNWSNGEPFQQWEHTMGGGNCVQLNSDRKWTPKDCSSQSIFLCYGDEHPLNTTGDLTIPVTPESTSPISTTTPTTLLPTATNGQSTTSPTTTTNGQSTTSPTTTANGQSTTSCTNYLHYVNESKSWINALEFCKSRGSKSNLVHITNQTVQADVTQLLANVELPCVGVWIGLERSIFEWSAPWLWTSGDVDKVVKYSGWHSCFPLNPINYHCDLQQRAHHGSLDSLQTDTM
ncbi:C-type mannose receptor 2 [Oncorhynchus mykiss]|uniref:C-type mannose receptor 2 n=1 Tax=Oncorhynchus mykiss TaxID=8022 RepID=UPI0018783CBD|nr:C-type mannose receptor 2 [Oncorhynchus mykiss]